MTDDLENELKKIMKSETRGLRLNDEKIRYDLIPPLAHRECANFPTQSPICGGDDGIPTELDGITFPKWRNESIKGYGNAVVPQVVYQIFKAIEQSLVSL